MKNMRVFVEKTAKNRGSAIEAKFSVEAGYGREHSPVYHFIRLHFPEFSSIQDIEGYEVNW